MQAPTQASNFDALTQAMSSDPIKLDLFRLTLSIAVNAGIDDLQRIGGPTDWHYEQAAKFSDELGAHGDALLYHVKGETARMMSRLCEVVAIGAFVPGGIKIMGLHFEAELEDQP